MVSQRDPLLSVVFKSNMCSLNAEASTCRTETCLFSVCSADVGWVRGAGGQEGTWLVEVNLLFSPSAVTIKSTSEILHPSLQAHHLLSFTCST